MGGGVQKMALFAFENLEVHTFTYVPCYILDNVHSGSFGMIISETYECLLLTKYRKY